MTPGASAVEPDPPIRTDLAGIAPRRAQSPRLSKTSKLPRTPRIHSGEQKWINFRER